MLELKSAAMTPVVATGQSAADVFQRVARILDVDLAFDPGEAELRAALPVDAFCSCSRTARKKSPRIVSSSYNSSEMPRAVSTSSDTVQIAG